MEDEKRSFSPQLQALPEKPGVYLMKDESGKVIYVGKAASLRNRVRSYFGSPTGLPPKTQQMVARIADFEVILTTSEQEALILECNLIKQYAPRYNVRLKDDKTYPYLKITNEDWPQVLITRRIEQDGARYFGPYANAGSVRTTMDLVKKLFPYRSCDRAITGKDPRPCLDYHINRCLGPCIGMVTKEEYQQVIKEVALFLEGRHEEVVRELRRQMEASADNLEFERAAFLRDQLRAVEQVIERQKIIYPRGGEQDIIAFAQEGNECCVQVFFIRSGKLFGREHFVMEGAQDEGPRQVMTSFLQQYYATVPHFPPTILLQHPVEETDVIREWLSQKRGSPLKIKVPIKGEKRRLIEMVAENARQTLQQLRAKWMADTGKAAAALEELKEHLNLPRLPHRMECYDISDIQGTSAVGSMVVFQEGKPKPSEYRRFRIKTVSGNDDYAMMAEVLRRRFRRARSGEKGPQEQRAWETPYGDKDEKAILSLQVGLDEPTEALSDLPAGSWGLLPDLLIIDGGKGHLSAALEVMRELGVHFVPTISLAKQNEEVFLPYFSEPVGLSRNSQGLYLLQRIRDEAHRFAITYHRKVRSKAMATSALDSVPGIGPKRKKALLKQFGSLKGIKGASLDQLAAVVGTRTLAQRVKELL